VGETGTLAVEIGVACMGNLGLISGRLGQNCTSEHGYKGPKAIPNNLRVGGEFRSEGASILSVAILDKSREQDWLLRRFLGRRFDRVGSIGVTSFLHQFPGYVWFVCLVFILLGLVRALTLGLTKGCLGMILSLALSANRERRFVRIAVMGPS